MAEKRKLPPRAGREPAAKRRVSEAVVATPQSQKKKKKEKEKAPTPRAPSPPPEPVEEPIPSKLKDADGIPVTRAHQFLTFTTPPALQYAVAYGLAKERDWFVSMRAGLQRSRDRLADGLSARGLRR